MSMSKEEYYAARIEDCCRKATITEDVEQRFHWLEAEARWLSLARNEGTVRLRRKAIVAHYGRDKVTRSLGGGLDRCR